MLHFKQRTCTWEERYGHLVRYPRYSKATGDATEAQKNQINWKKPNEILAYSAQILCSLLRCHYLTSSATNYTTYRWRHRSASPVGWFTGFLHLHNQQITLCDWLQKGSSQLYPKKENKEIVEPDRVYQSFITVVTLACRKEYYITFNKRNMVGLMNWFELLITESSCVLRWKE